MLKSGSVTAKVESCRFWVRFADPEMLRPMFENVCEKLTELARVLCV